MEADFKKSVDTDFKLTLTIGMTETDYKQYRSKVKEKLSNHDPDEELIKIMTMVTEQLDGIKQKREERLSLVKSNMIITQSIAIHLFNVDTTPNLHDMDTARTLFGEPPWKFHHITERNTLKSSTNRLHARQEYFELAETSPLFTAGRKHYGKPTLRVTIFTLNHKEMLEYYGKLLGINPAYNQGNFLYFETHSENLTLQLALKHSPTLMPYPISTTKVSIQAKNSHKLGNIDPDGNQIEMEPTPYEDSENCYLKDLDLKIPLKKMADEREWRDVRPDLIPDIEPELSPGEERSHQTNEHSKLPLPAKRLSSTKTITDLVATF